MNFFIKNKLDYHHCWLFFLLVFLVASGFGCQGLSQSEKAAIKPIVLEYWTVFDDVDALQKLIAKYRADRPYLTINLRQLRTDELYPRLIEALAEDRGPDIVSVRSRALRGLKSKLAPLPPQVKDTTIRVIKGRISTQTIVTPTTKNTLTIPQLEREYVKAVRQDVVMDGGIYGLPLSLDTLALFYNKDLLDRAGIAEPPTTWEEFQAAAKKLTKYDKQSGKIIQAGAALGTGINVPGSDDLLYVLYRQSGLDFTTPDGTAIFNSVPRNYEAGTDTPAMAVMNFYTDFANPSRDTYSWNDTMDNALDAFVNGRLGFFFGFSYHDALIRARAPQLNVAIVPLPQLNPEQPANAANYWVQSVLLKSNKQNEAWALVDYLTHSNATKEYLDATKRPTALRAFIPAQREITELVPFVSQVLVAENWYRGSNYDAAVKGINDLLHDWLVAPADPNRLLERRQELLNRAAATVNQTR